MSSTLRKGGKEKDGRKTNPVTIGMMENAIKRKRIVEGNTSATNFSQLYDRERGYYRRENGFNLGFDQSSA